MFASVDLTLDDFTLNDRGRVVSRPAGHAPSASSDGPQEFVVEYDRCVCQSCPLLARCPLGDRKTKQFRGRWRYRGSAVIQRARRRKEQSPEFRDTYRPRAGIEAALSRLKHDRCLCRLRVGGLKRVSFVVLLRALGLTIGRSAAFKS